MVNTPALLETAQGVSKKNLALYAVTVHGIKGSSRGICAETVGAKAEALEKAAKEGNYDFIMANNADLLETAGKLIDDLKDMFGRKASEGLKPRKEKPDDEVLSRLFSACDVYDMEGVDRAMTEIESFEYEGDDGLSVWLRENVDQMNFTEIKEKLSAQVLSDEDNYGRYP